VNVEPVSPEEILDAVGGIVTMDPHRAITVEMVMDMKVIAILVNVDVGSILPQRVFKSVSLRVIVKDNLPFAVEVILDRVVRVGLGLAGSAENEESSKGQGHACGHCHPAAAHRVHVLYSRLQGKERLGCGSGLSRLWPTD
jgi:hypothetical protein